MSNNVGPAEAVYAADVRLADSRNPGRFNKIDPSRNTRQFTLNTLKNLTVYSETSRPILFSDAYGGRGLVLSTPFDEFFSGPPVIKDTLLKNNTGAEQPEQFKTINQLLGIITTETAQSQKTLLDDQWKESFIGQLFQNRRFARRLRALEDYEKIDPQYRPPIADMMTFANVIIITNVILDSKKYTEIYTAGPIIESEEFIPVLMYKKISTDADTLNHIQLKFQLLNPDVINFLGPISTETTKLFYDATDDTIKRKFTSVQQPNVQGQSAVARVRDAIGNFIGS